VAVLLHEVEPFKAHTFCLESNNNFLNIQDLPAGDCEWVRREFGNDRYPQHGSIGIEDDGEQILVIKTTEERVDELRDFLFARHPYEVPEFVVLAGEVGGAYADWLLHSL